MTLPVSGPLSFKDINEELAKVLQPGRLGTAAINFNEADVRWLASKIGVNPLTGLPEAIVLPDDFYGKGYFNLVPDTTDANEGPVTTTLAPVTTTTPAPTTTTPAPLIGVITVTPFEWTWDLTPTTTTTTTPAPAALPSPSTGCIIEGSLLEGLNSPITSGVASITGSLSGTTVWGNNVYGYTSDSDFAVAAVHAGILTPGQTGNVAFTNLGSKPGPFPSTTANGVTTTAWLTSWCTVKLSAA